ncbi:barstar family protein [Micromonospora sp. NBC_00330]|uniref:barstar family protein n=1 Tax=Micromonospora sp. NBC_00330 TaxID=2903585 RepID=UPI002E28B822|nr:barstar family protein [Micromonospora sp. NBC_00330]
MSSWWNGSTEQVEVCSRTALVELAAVLPAAGRFVVARLDGTRMADADHTFYEFSDALLFPGYFGWNWAALSDCLRDLHWLPADGYLVVVENGPRVLSSSAEDRHTLFQILAQAVHHWASPFGQPAFKVLLLCDRDDEATLLRQEIARAGAATPHRDRSVDRRP